MANKFNGEGYFSPTEFEAFTRLEKEERAVRRAAAYRPLIYICSPFSGDVRRNVRNARRYSRFALMQHTIPFAPHLLFPQFMDDDNPAERDLAMFMNMVMLGRCEELWVFGDIISDGMSKEIARAKRKAMKIRYFTTELEEKK